MKNWWVLICTRLTATVALSQTTIYKRIGSPSLPIGLLSVLVGNSESLHEIFAEDNYSLLFLSMSSKPRSRMKLPMLPFIVIRSSSYTPLIAFR